MPKMLRNRKRPDEVYPLNPNLLKHEDMEVFDPVDPQFAEAAMSEEEQKAAADAEAIALAAKKKPVRRKKSATADAQGEPDISDLNLDDA